jgi:hypothetical protein
MTETRMAKLLVEVQWGIIPGQVDGNKQWGFDRAQVESASSWQELMASAYGEFEKRMDPSFHNWVTLTWLWL